MSCELDRIVLWGRSRREYELMFALGEAEQGQRVLVLGGVAA